MSRVKKTVAYLVVLVLVGFAVYWFWEPAVPRAQPNEATRVSVDQGELIGFSGRAKTFVWQGIPYAEPPVGPLRWRAPQAAPHWQGTLEATQFSSSCPQIGGSIGGVSWRKHGKPIGNEDCLYLNIWAPADAFNKLHKRPVMFWIHGGGNSIGTASTYYGAQLAATQNVVVVTINYRLGVFGWFRHQALRAGAQDAADRSGNYGVLDMVAALEWVRTNIESFAGDPGNVTIFGESAGGHNVAALLGSPLASGLFHRAIVQSGSFRTSPLDFAEAFEKDLDIGHVHSAKEVVNMLLVANGLARTSADAKRVQTEMSNSELAEFLRQQPAEAFLRQFGDPSEGMYLIPTQFRDGHVLPEGSLVQLIKAGKHNRVPVMMGTNRDEFKIFASDDPIFIDKRFGFLPTIRDVEQYNRITGYFSDAWQAQAVVDAAEAMKAWNSVYVYRFDWDEAPDSWLANLSVLLGAGHALELPFVFGEFFRGLPLTNLFNDDNLPGSNALAGAMMSYWGQFAESGDPGQGRAGTLQAWPLWQGIGTQSVMLLDSPAGGGARTGNAAVTVAQIKDRLVRDAKLTQELRCDIYANLFLHTFQETVDWSPAEYGELGDSGCNAFPAENFFRLP